VSAGCSDLDNLKEVNGLRRRFIGQRQSAQQRRPMPSIASAFKRIQIIIASKLSFLLALARLKTPFVANSAAPAQAAAALTGLRDGAVRRVAFHY
jgi:hypothetical protein